MIILIVLGALVVLFFIGGLIYTLRRNRRGEAQLLRDAAAADQALEQARASDRGWDRAALEAAARKGIEAERPDFAVDELHLVLVDDRPGMTEDRAEMVAIGPGGRARVGLVRDDAGSWSHDRVEPAER